MSRYSPVSPVQPAVSPDLPQSQQLPLPGYQNVNGAAWNWTQGGTLLPAGGNNPVQQPVTNVQQHAQGQTNNLHVQYTADILYNATSHQRVQTQNRNVRSTNVNNASVRQDSLQQNQGLQCYTNTQGYVPRPSAPSARDWYLMNYGNLQAYNQAVSSQTRTVRTSQATQLNAQSAPLPRLGTHPSFGAAPTNQSRQPSSQNACAPPRNRVTRQSLQGMDAPLVHQGAQPSSCAPSIYPAMQVPLGNRDAQPTSQAMPA